jgi:hypothetical protein
MSLFAKEQVTDDKRLVRGEHLLLARYWLRVRDGAPHHQPWKVLMLAGGCPKEEVEAIRELMPKAHIVAADFEKEMVGLALAAGANEGFVGDVAEIDIVEHGYHKTKMLSKRVADLGKFDLIDLDFCAHVSEQMRTTLNTHFRELTHKGCLMLTFSYGRDVEEVADHAYKSFQDHEAYESLYDLESHGCRFLSRKSQINCRKPLNV